MAKAINCQCCKQQRSSINGERSALILSMNIIICGSCRKAGHEPRHIIVLAARSGVDVREYVKNRSYCGKSLEAVEVLP